MSYVGGQGVPHPGGDVGGEFLQPVAGMVISYLLIGERYTIWLALGAAMITAGIWRVNKR